MGWEPPSPPVCTCYCWLILHLPPTPFPVFQAQAVTLTVAQAFKVAFEFWQVSKEGESSSWALGVTLAEAGTTQESDLG